MSIVKVGVILSLELSFGVLHEVELDINEHAFEVVAILRYQLLHHANIVAVQLFMALLILDLLLLLEVKYFCEVGLRHFRGLFLWFYLVIRIRLQILIDVFKLGVT